jgi:hypothetical protein
MNWLSFLPSSYALTVVLASRYFTGTVPCPSFLMVRTNPVWLPGFAPLLLNTNWTETDMHNVEINEKDLRSAAERRAEEIRIEFANFKGMLAGMVYRWRSGNFVFIPGIHDPAQLCAEELYKFVMESYQP